MSCDSFWVMLCCFPHRWTWGSSEEDLHKVGEFSLGSCVLPNYRPVHWPSRWEDAHQTPGSAFRRETCKCLLISIGGVWFGFGWGFVNPWLNCSIGNLSAEGSALKMSFDVLKEKKKALLLQLDPGTIKMPSYRLQWESKDAFFKGSLLVTCWVLPAACSLLPNLTGTGHKMFLSPLDPLVVVS